MSITIVFLIPAVASVVGAAVLAGLLALPNLRRIVTGPQHRSTQQAVFWAGSIALWITALQAISFIVLADRIPPLGKALGACYFAIAGCMAWSAATAAFSLQRRSAAPSSWQTQTSGDAGRS